MCSSVAVMDQTLISECRMMLRASREFNTQHLRVQSTQNAFFDERGQRRMAR